MKKEEILQKSRQENAGHYDERALSIFGISSRIGLGVGGTLCVILVLISEFVLNNALLSSAGWMVYLGMFGTQKLVLYKYLREKKSLIFGIINILMALLSFALLLVKG